MYWRGGSPNLYDIIVGIVFISGLLVALKKETGWVLVGLIMFFILYMKYGTKFLGVFAHGGLKWDHVIFRAFITNEGTWGSTITVSSA